MPKYRVQRDGIDVALDSIRDSRTKVAIEAVIGTFDKHFGSIQCDVHHVEPLVFIHVTSGACTGFGFGPCCENFAKELLVLAKNLKLPGIPQETPVTMRVLKYSEIG